MSFDALALISTPALAMAFAGFAFGLVYFLALQRTVILFADGGGWLGALALTLGRIGAVTILLMIAASLGAMQLLATFLVPTIPEV